MTPIPLVKVDQIVTTFCFYYFLIIFLKIFGKKKSVWNLGCLVAYLTKNLTIRPRTFKLFSNKKLTKINKISLEWIF